MLVSSVPAKFPIPFAISAGAGYKRVIPTPSQIGIQNGAASLTDGFPPNCFVPPGSGGAWPFGQDFNGLLNQVTSWNQWEQMGGPVFYDAAFSAAIGGYPQGALISNASTLGAYWISQVDNNTSDPDTGGANWLGVSFIGGNNGVIGAGVLILSSATTLTSANFGYLIEITGSSTYVVTIPSTASVGGKGYTFWNNSAVAMTLASGGGNFYANGQVTAGYSIPPNGSCLVISDGTRWFVITVNVANTSQYGLARQATPTECANGVTTGVAPAFVSPEGLAGYSRWTVVGVTVATVFTKYYVFIECGAASQITTTLPTPVGNNSQMAFWNDTAFNQIVTASTGLFFGPLGAGVGSITVPPGYTVFFQSDGTNWIASLSPAIATTTNYGIAREATLAEAEAGVTSGSVPAFVTPEGLVGSNPFTNPLGVGTVFMGFVDFPETAVNLTGTFVFRGSVQPYGFEGSFGGFGSITGTDYRLPSTGGGGSVPGNWTVVSTTSGTGSIALIVRTS